MLDEESKENPPLDFSRIQDTSDGDAEFEQELFAAYIEDCSDRIARLRGAIADQDSASLRREAHTIKGASANVGTTQLHELAQALESADPGANGGATTDLVAEIEAEFDRVKTAIESYLGAG